MRDWERTLLCLRTLAIHEQHGENLLPPRHGAGGQGVRAALAVLEANGLVDVQWDGDDASRYQLTPNACRVELVLPVIFGRGMGHPG